MEIERNKGYVEKSKDGYLGYINVDGCIMAIYCTFWMSQKPPYIYIQRCKKLKFDEKNKTFKEYIPKPILQIKADLTKKSDNVRFRGSFMFIGFKYEIAAWWDDEKTKKVLRFDVVRSENQTLLKRINELLIKNNK